MAFPYPPLPAGSDALRVLTLSPATGFWDPLVATLEAVPFSAKPKYIALSYTWADTDSEHAAIPAMPEPSPYPELIAKCLAVGQTADEKSAGSLTVEGGREQAQHPENSRLTQKDDVNAPPSSPSAGSSTGPATDRPGRPPPLPPCPPPHIILNGHSFPLQHNVTLALRFLRSPTHALPLWIDAVCINQRSVPERNAQVSLMAFIYTRAAAVLSWLGVCALPDDLSVDRAARAALPSYLARAWERGLARHIAAHFAATYDDGGDGRPSPPVTTSGTPSGPDLFRFAHPFLSRDTDATHPLWGAVAAGQELPRVHGNSYWSRLWVVQEVCLPRSIAFVAGGEVWTEGAVQQMLTIGEQRQPPGTLRHDTTMQRLLSARRDRFADLMRLEALVERFMASGCSELRDRVFGLAGLANNVSVFAQEGPPKDAERAEETNNDQKTNADADRAPAPPIGVLSELSQAAPDAMPIEGSAEQTTRVLGLSKWLRKSVAEVADPRQVTGITEFLSFVGGHDSSRTAEPRVPDEPRKPSSQQEATTTPTRKRGRGRLRIDYSRSFYSIWRDVVDFMYFQAKPQLDFGRRPRDREDERCIKLVRFAGVVQTAFEGRVEEEVACGRPPPDLRPEVPLKLKGYVAGTIRYLGPAYDSFVGSFREHERWISSWDLFYDDEADLQKLRRMEEAYSTKIVRYTRVELARIRRIECRRTLAWTRRRVSRLDDDSASTPTAQTHRNHELQLQQPVRFLGSDLCMGLAPPESRVGDLVLRFWNCDAAIVVRRLPLPTPHKESTGAPEDYFCFTLVGRADIAEPYVRLSGGADVQAKEALMTQNKEAYVVTTFGTLQKISAAIAI